MSADDSPQPTAHDVFPGCSLDRRTFIRGTGASAAAIAAGGAGTAASSGTVAADDSVGLVDGVKSAVSGAASNPGASYGLGKIGVAGTISLAGYSALRDALTTDPSEDDVILHQICRSEVESLAAHEVNFNNRLNDARPVANLEARHGIASAWEDDESATSAYDIALQRIRQHYETPEFNHIHTTNKSLLQYSYVAGAAEPLVEDGGDREGLDAYFTALAFDPDDDDESYQLQLTNDREVVDYELSDGTSIDNVNEDEADDILDDFDSAELETPIVEIFEIDDDGDVDSDDPIGSFPIINEEIVDSWDDDDEVVTIETDDGTELEWDYRFTNGGFDEDDESDENPDSAPITVFDGREFCKIVQRIWDDSDTVTGNYTSDFVEDLYDELEAGNINPEQVRSPEGMVHFLSGTDDPSNERFQVAMMQQFGMEQPDFSMVSGMEVTWSGATDTTVDVDPELDDRHIYPSGYETEQDFDGVVFGDNLPDGGYQSGGRYAVAPLLYFGGGDGVHALDPVERTPYWEQNPDGSVQDVFVSKSSETVFVATNEVALAIDATDGSVKWENSADADAIVHSDETGQAYYNDDEDVVAVDAEDGSEDWTHSNSSSIDGLEPSPDGETLFVAASTNGLLALETSSGEQNWSDGMDNGATSVAATPNGQLVIAGDRHDGDVTAFDAESGEEEWENTDPGDSSDATVATDDAIYTAGGWDGVVAIDHDGATLWEADTDDRPRDLAPTPDDNLLHVVTFDGDHVEFDTDDGTEEHSETEFYDGLEAVSTMRADGSIDAVAGRSMIFDDGQVDLWNGVLEIHDKYDADGATIEHVDDETIDDLEEATGEDIDTILEEVDGYDDESDIRFTRDVIEILEFYDAEDEIENVHTNETDYSRPEYDTYDSEEFAEFLNELEDYQDSLEDDDETNVSVGIDNPLDDFGDGAVWVGLAVIVLAIVTIVSIVTDFIPILNN